MQVAFGVVDEVVDAPGGEARSRRSAGLFNESFFLFGESHVDAGGSCHGCHDNIVRHYAVHFKISAAGLRDDVGGPERRDEGEANVVGRGLVIFGPEGEQMGEGKPDCEKYGDARGDSAGAGERGLIALEAGGKRRERENDA